MSKSLITDEEILVLDQRINVDENFPAVFRQDPMVREVLRAGLWLTDELDRLNCDPVLALQFQYTHGQNSFGHDPWEQAQILLDSYKNGSYTVGDN